MSVRNGQFANQTTFNNAFMSRTDSTTSTVAAVTFENTTDTTSSSTGSIICAGGVGIAKALYVGTTITSVGNASIGGALNVTGATTLSSTLGVTGAATFANTISVTGLATLASASITGSANIGGSLGVTGDIIAANIESIDAIVAGGDITATGDITGNNLSGTNTGDVSIGDIGTSPNDKGITLTDQVLNLEPANETYGGILSAVAQSIAGIKTFIDNLKIASGKALMLLYISGETTYSVSHQAGALTKDSVYQWPDLPASAKALLCGADGIMYWGTASGGGGGGGGANWQPYQGNAPLEDYEYNEKVFKFQTGLAQAIVLWVRVPSSYEAGNQIKMNMGQYSISSTDYFKFKAVTTLIQKDVDAITSTTNQNTTANSDVTNSVANQYRTIQYNLTDSTGKINSVAVAAGDLLKIEFSRDTATGTDDTNDVRTIPSMTEVLFS